MNIKFDIISSITILKSKTFGNPAPDRTQNAPHRLLYLYYCKFRCHSTGHKIRPQSTFKERRTTYNYNAAGKSIHSVVCGEFFKM